ncbi:glucose dehydrogenase [FAD, quinone]-like isoform X2 [Coccinella septempunctata]|nr:glucose dehydrogenase [FAD, quinone]-like isoform X2 [Coccinella septempunctata]
MKIIHICAFLAILQFEKALSQVQDMLVASLEKNLQEEETVRTFLNNIHNVVNRYSKVYDNIDKDYWASTEDWIPRFTLRTSYDFIIVGSGPAGSVIANRLSEIPEWKVLLIEAGDYETNFMDVPLAAPVFQYSKYNWEYYAEYQPKMFEGLMGGRMHWPRGKALGGTSTINYMIYTRGNPVDYNKWASQGNPGWSYNEVLPYFLKSERARLSERDPDVHNNDGLLGVENVYKSRLLDAFIAGGGELGLPHIDYNSPKIPFGVSRVQATVKSGKRHSAATSFLRPVRNRTNLHILHPAYVTKLLIHKTKREVYGVECEIGGKIYKIKASKEVILSAGAFNSPQLLMLSGIGPADHLRGLGIKVLQDLPVGRNLHDHLTFPGLAFIINQTESLGPAKVMGGDALGTFIQNGTGPLTSLGGVEGIGYIKTQYATEPGPQPDIELIFVGGSLASDYGIVTRRGMKITNKVYDGLLRPLHGLPTWTVFPMLLHPKSIGWMELTSRNPKDYPKFYGNFFTDPYKRDIKTFIAAIRFVQRLSRTNAFQRFGSVLNPNRHPGCTQFKFDSDDYWECCLRSISVTLHHQVGTAKMGPSNDPTSVVDHQLKVHGVKRLRVADCSIIPFALSAHTNAPSFMIGEKAADMIKEQWLNDANLSTLQDLVAPSNEVKKRSS